MKICEDSYHINENILCKLDKSMLDIKHMTDDGDMIMIPLLPSIDKLVNAFDIAFFANETGSDCGDEWDLDYDSNDSHLILVFWLNEFFDKECKNNLLTMTAVIAPIHWTQEEIDAEIQREKEHEQNEPEMYGGYDSYRIGEYDDGKPMYMWQQYKDQYESELEWYKKHPNYKEKYEGNVGCLDISASQEELDELYKMLLSIPEIKAAYDEFNNAFLVKAVG